MSAMIPPGPDSIWRTTVQPPGARGPSAPVDWAALKRDIIGRLDVVAEYASLGLRVVGGVNPETSKVQARAMGREDSNPSAFVAVDSGRYYAHGDPPESLSFWDFALRYGGFADYAEMIRHYARRAGVEMPAFRKNSHGLIEEACYAYADRAGEILYEVVRYRQPTGKKTFRQRRPDPKTPGGWIYNLDGVTRVPYRLPDLAERPDEPVWFVEGEKDADALAAVGVLATTTPQGAEAGGRRLWEEGTYSEHFRGRDVRVVPDQDVPGRALADVVARSLVGVAASIRVVTLPGLPHKGDASDWLVAGGTAEDLARLADESPDFDPGLPAADAEAADPARDAHAGDLVAAQAGTRWLCEGWIPLSVLTLLTAEPSTGKTRFCLDLTKRIANLSTWPDGRPIVLPDGLTNRVLWVPADNQHAELADAPAAYGFPCECLRLNTSVGDLFGGTELQSAEQLKDFEDRIRRIRPALVVIDTVTNTSDYKSQDTSDAKRQYKPLQEIAKRTGAAIMCVTHLNVAGKTLGRRADEKTRVTIRLECPDPEGQPNRRRLSVALSRLSVYPPALGVTMGDSGNEYDTNPPVAPGDARSEQVAKMPAPAVQEAMGFLTLRLGQGSARVSMVRKEAEQREPPISAKSLYAAVRHLKVEEYEQEGRKWWRLAADRAAANAHDADGETY